jgi:hypothetical protein
MAASENLAERVAVLELEVARLKQNAGEAKPNWVDKLLGSFENDPEFDEIISLGREYRASQQPETHG